MTIDGQAVSVVSAIVGALVTVIITFWRLHIKKADDDAEKLKACESDRAETAEELRALTGEVEYLKGRMDGVESLSASVLGRLDEANKDAAG